MKRIGAAGWLLFALQPALAADSYTMDALHCIPSFEFVHLGVTSQTGRFDRARGKITLDRAGHKGNVWYEVDTASLDMGSGTEEPDSPGFQLLEVANFPTITFRSDNLYFDDSGRVIAAQGKLTLLGVARPLTVWLSQFKCAPSPQLHREVCAADITATITRSEFGMLRFIPAISDEIKIRVPVEAYKN